jgi:SulP family sulfate permease
VGEIPQGLPMPALPQLGELSFDLVSGAFAVAALVLIQGAGVSESAPNPDGSRAEPNRDFLAQGVGNVLSGLFRGQPVGGSVGQTALSVAAGARTRWAAIFAGIWMAIILLAFSGIVGQVAMPTLAAVLIVAAIGSLPCAPGSCGRSCARHASLSPDPPIVIGRRAWHRPAGAL